MATILIVDDRPTNRELLITLLGYAGHHLLEAVDGEQALVIARAQHPDLIITDIVMPKMDGYEFARQVRADPTIRSTQIVFYTSSFIVSETKRLAEACGVSLVIGKPIEPQDFLDQIHQALHAKQPPPAPTASEDFHHEHMQLLTDALAQKVDELEAEAAERQRAQTRLSESEELFRTAFQHSPVGLCLVTLDGKFQLINQSLAEMLGYTPDELAGKHFNDLTYPDDQEIGAERLKSLLADEVPSVSFEKRYQHKSGQPLWAHITSTLLRDKAGKPLHFITHVMNISERKQAEQQLQQSEENFSKAFSSSPTALMITRLLDGKYLEMNEAYTKIVGYERAELIGHLSTEFNIYVSVNQRSEIVSQLRAHGALYNYEATIQNKAGQLRTVLASLELIQFNSETCILTTLLDITERKQAEEALRETEARFSKIFHVSPIGIIIFGLVDGRSVDVNEAFLQIVGYARNEVIGHSADDLHLFVDQQTRDNWITSLRQEDTVRNQYARIRRQSGEIRDVLASIDVIDVSGQHMALVAALDVTDLRQAEEHIRYQANLLENVSDAIIATDLDSRITRWNLAAEEIYGWRADEVIGKQINDFLKTEYQTAMPPGQIREKFLKEGRWQGEVTQTRKDGKKIAVLVSVSLVVDDTTGAPRAMVTINRDITERKQTEENLRVLNIELEQRVAERTAELTHANRAKDEFLANMSHELRTPLNTVLGLSEILLEQRRGPLTEAQEHALQLITSSGQHLLNLINDVLEVSKIEAGKLQIHPDIILVKEVCESSLNFVKELALKKSIVLDYWNSTEIEKVNADPQRLKQILVNLLTNAVKFTPERGNVSLEVELNPEGDQIQFIVSDTGIGIAHEDLHRLFTPFTQLDSSLARQYAGTGLGLVVVFKFTELHGGSVHVESEVGRGSRFTVTLPWDEALARLPHTDSTSPIIAESETDLASTLPQRGTILLAEDNEANIMLLSDYLQDHGFEVAVARNGFEALDQAEKLSPGLILMDIQMPDMDGLEAIRRLRANPRFSSTPIIALTALAMSGDRERCLIAGADEYISKPIRLKSLIKTITHMLELKKKSAA